MNREIVVKAINQIINHPEKRNGRESTTYDLVYEEVIYRPILVFSATSKFAGGEELTLGDLNNSTDKAFSILENLGFKITSSEEEYYERKGI